MVFSLPVPSCKQELRNRLRFELTPLSQESQLRPGEHVQSRGRQAPGIGTIMITPCNQFYFQPPHLDPTHAVSIPELIHADGS
jgi:hypothetical protein